LLALVLIVSCTAPAQAGEAPPLLQSPDGGLRLKLGARLHVDVRAPLLTCTSALDCSEPPREVSFVARRSQLQLGATLFEVLDSEFVIDFRGGGETRVEHAFLAFRPHEWLQLQLGLGKVPMGYEFFVLSSNHTDFMERSLLFTNLHAQPYELGVALHGTAWNKRVAYWVGLSQNMAFDLHHQNLVARVSIAPMEGLWLGVSGAWGEREEILEWVSATGVEGEHWEDRYLFVLGPHHRLGGELALYRGPASFKAEYGQRFDTLEDGQGVSRQGLYASASWVLTGERKTARGVEPHAPLLPTERWRGPGAWELATRYGQLWGKSPSEEAPDTFHRIHEFSLGLNWYLTPNVRWMLGLNGYHFQEGSEDDKAFLEVLSRAQLAF
jgi:hypothetical protein